MSIEKFSFPTPIHFGVGARKLVGPHLKNLGFKRPLIVTDKALNDLPLMAEFIAHLSGLEVAVYAGVHGNPTASQVTAGGAAFKAHNADCVIGLGGGASLDVAKVVGLAATHDGPILEYAWDHPKVRSITGTLPYFVALPTTSGTGSEVGRAGVLTNSLTHKKKIIFHPKLLPVVVICDPALTVGMPRFITAGTGMDALAHCLEAYCSPFYHPMSQGIALEGMRLVFENLPKVYANPNDLDARAHMMSAAAMGAVAFQKGLGAIHSLSHPVGAVYGTHHGTTNAVVMPMVLEMNRPAIEDRIVKAAAYLGFEGGFAGFHDQIMELRTLLNIPENLSAMGVQFGDLDMLTEMALEDPSCGGNPIAMTRENTRALFDACM